MRPQLKMTALVVAAVLLGGCAAGPHARLNDNRFDAFYDGKSSTQYATELPSADAVEALARGDRALRKGDTDLALYQYVQALKHDPKNVLAFERIGAIHLERGNYGLAERAFRGAVAQQPGHAGAQEGLGLALLHERQYDEAKQHLEAATTADIHRWRAHDALGVLFDLRNDPISARREYETALRLRPNSPLILNNLGYSAYLHGDDHGALEYLRRAVAQDPKYAQAWRNLGLVYARTARYDRALDAFGRVMDTPAAYNNIGYVCLSEQRYDDARRFLNQAIDLSPKYYAVAYQNLSLARDPDHTPEAP